jgi:GNAT superfamily N-acetyltransferase
MNGPVAGERCFQEAGWMISLAKDSQKEEMAQLWQLCFGDPTEYIHNFFERQFDPSKTLVYVLDQRVVSVVYMLDASIYLEGREEPAQYLYAGCTHPDYRKRGIFERVVEYACNLAIAAGQRFSILLPASDPLYDYYGHISYMEYFKKRRIDCSTDSLKAQGDSDFRLLDVTPERVYRIRTALFGRREGSVLWDEATVAFAISAIRVFGGQVKCFEYQRQEGYVLGYVDKGTAIIQELGIEPGLWPAAAQVIADYFLAPAVQLSLPGDMNILNGWGETARWGMIRPLDEEARVLWINTRDITPYLGLALD